MMAESQNAFVEDALLRRLKELRREKVHSAYEEAAQDPAFIKDMGTISETFGITALRPSFPAAPSSAGPRAPPSMAGGLGPDGVAHGPVNHPCARNCPTVSGAAGWVPAPTPKQVVAMCQRRLRAYRDTRS